MKIELKNVSLGYEKRKPLFEGINLTVENKSFILIRGASGTGKTSLLKLLNNLHEPTAGDILFDGTPASETETTRLRRQVAYLQQLPAMFEGSVESNLMLSFRFHSAKHQTPPDRDRLRKLLDEYSLDDISLDEEATKLSVGQKQRVALVRTLVTAPQIILCDEPTSALDPQSRRVVENGLERIHIEDNIGVVMVAHLEFTPEHVKAKRFHLTHQDGLKELAS